jgi:hypothetical protein
MSRDRREAVASSSGGHSSVTDVCVTLRSCGYRISRASLKKRGTDVNLWGVWRSLTKFFQDIALQFPEFAFSFVFFCYVLRNGDVHN